MSNDIQVMNEALPAHLKGAVGVDDSLSANTSSSFPVLSLRGKVWRLTKDKVQTVIHKPDEPDEPASTLEVVILSANKNLSKVFYAGAYVEGSTDGPDCFSNDGIRPDPSVTDPVHSNCDSCPNNVWGSKITDAGTKIKACADSRRVAVATPDKLSEPLLLRVPGASLQPLAAYSKELAGRGIPYHGVITRLSFDSSSSFPKLQFKAKRYLDEDTFAAAEEARKAPILADITGMATANPQATAAIATDVADSPASEETETSLEPEVAKAKAAASKAKSKAAASKAKAKAGSDTEAPDAGDESVDSLLNDLGIGPSDD